MSRDRVGVRGSYKIEPEGRSDYLIEFVPT